jgi:hypothetical protein
MINVSIKAALEVAMAIINVGLSIIAMCCSLPACRRSAAIADRNAQRCLPDPAREF